MHPHQVRTPCPSSRASAAGAAQASGEWRAAGEQKKGGGLE